MTSPKGSMKQVNSQLCFLVVTRQVKHVLRLYINYNIIYIQLITIKYYNLYKSSIHILHISLDIFGLHT